MGVEDVKWGVVGHYMAHKSSVEHLKIRYEYFASLEY